MRKKRIMVINRKYQHGTAMSVSGVVFIFSSIVFLVLTLHAINTGRSLASTVAELDAAVNTEDNIVNAFLKYSKKAGATGLVLHTKKISLDHEKSMRAVRERVVAIRRGIFMNYAIIAVLGVVFVLQGVILYRHCIRLTHRVAGPMRVIRGCLEDISAGKVPDFRRLRKGDEFKDVYEQLMRAVERMKDAKEKGKRTKAEGKG